MHSILTIAYLNRTITADQKLTSEVKINPFQRLSREMKPPNDRRSAALPDA
jgi:hypothetical protein